MWDLIVSVPDHCLSFYFSNLGYSKKMYYTIQATNNIGADQTARMRRLICVFGVRIWINRFSNDAAQIICSHYKYQT